MIRALVLLVVLAAPSHAQGTQTAPPTLDAVPGRVFDGLRSVPPGAAPTPAAAARLDFTPAPERRQQAIGAFLQEVAQLDPGLAATLKAEFARVDVFAELQAAARQLYGPAVSVNNVADVWALYWGYAWLLSRGRTDDPPAAQMRALRAQFQGVLLAQPGVVGSDATKQAVSDPLALQVVLFSVLSEAWKGQTETLAEYGRALSASSRDLGFDLGAVTLTERGFVASAPLVTGTQGGLPQTGAAQPGSAQTGAAQSGMSRPAPAPAPGPLGFLGPKAALPAVKPVNAAQFIAGGGNPEAQVIPDEFRCYQERRGSGLSPELALQVLPGGRYRTAYGAGTYRVVKDGSLIKPQWLTGPLGGASGYLSFDDDGQTISLMDVGEDRLENGLNFECYQRGPRENRQLLEFRLRTPPAASFACVSTDGQGARSTLQLLAGGAYRLGSGTGTYRVNFRTDQDDDWSDLDFTGGTLDDETGIYEESREGVQTVRVRGAKIECSRVVKPTPMPRFGSAKAPAPPKGSGGLSGVYAAAYSDPSAILSGGGCVACWDVIVFDKGGYAYTAEPDASLGEADCTRTRPNGQPLCEPYRVQGARITFGRESPDEFRRSGKNLEIGSRTYQPALSLQGAALSGTYTSTTFIGGGLSTVSGAFSTTLTFLPQGRFTRQRSGGVSVTVTDTGTSAGNTVGGVSTSSDRSSSGTYRVDGYTLILTYGDGHVERLFAYGVAGSSGRLDLELLRVGGQTYTRPDR